MAHKVKRDPGKRQRHGAVHHRKVFSRRLFPNSVTALALNLLLIPPGTFFVPSFGLPMSVGRISQNRTSPVHAASKNQTNEQVFYRVPSLEPWTLDPSRSRTMSWNTEVLSLRPRNPLSRRHLQASYQPHAARSLTTLALILILTLALTLTQDPAPSAYHIFL